MNRPEPRLDRRQRGRTEVLHPTRSSMPCDRCLDVTPLYPDGPQLLCVACHPGIREKR